jgi:hypothetical protein
MLRLVIDNRKRLEVVGPKVECSSASRFTEEIMAGILDGQSDIVFLGELDTSDSITSRADINVIDGEMTQGCWTGGLKWIGAVLIDGVGEGSWIPNTVVG